MLYIYTWYNMYPTATCNSDGWDVPRDLTVIILCGLSCITLPFLREISGTLRFYWDSRLEMWLEMRKCPELLGWNNSLRCLVIKTRGIYFTLSVNEIYLVSICWCCKATNITLQVVVLRLYVPSPKIWGLSPTKHYQWNIFKGWLNHQSTSR